MDLAAKSTVCGFHTGQSEQASQFGPAPDLNPGQRISIAGFTVTRTAENSFKVERGAHWFTLDDGINRAVVASSPDTDCPAALQTAELYSSPDRPGELQGYAAFWDSPRWLALWPRLANPRPARCRRQQATRLLRRWQRLGCHRGDTVLLGAIASRRPSPPFDPYAEPHAQGDQRRRRLLCKGWLQLDVPMAT